MASGALSRDIGPVPVSSKNSAGWGARGLLRLGAWCALIGAVVPGLAQSRERLVLCAAPGIEAEALRRFADKLRGAEAVAGDCNRPAAGYRGVFSSVGGRLVFTLLPSGGAPLSRTLPWHAEPAEALSTLAARGRLGALAVLADGLLFEEKLSALEAVPKKGPAKKPPPSRVKRRVRRRPKKRARAAPKPAQKPKIWPAAPPPEPPPFEAVVTPPSVSAPPPRPRVAQPVVPADDGPTELSLGVSLPLRVPELVARGAVFGTASWDGLLMGGAYQPPARWSPGGRTFDLQSAELSAGLRPEIWRRGAAGLQWPTTALLGWVRVRRLDVPATGHDGVELGFRTGLRLSYGLPWSVALQGDVAARPIGTRFTVPGGPALRQGWFGARLGISVGWRR